MSGKRSRTKGHNFERWLVNFLKEHFKGCHTHRGLQSQGAVVPDVFLEFPDGVSAWWECKVGARPNIKKALEQAERDALKASNHKSLILTCVKFDREEPIVSMRLQEFVRLFSYLVLEPQINSSWLFGEGENDE